MARWTRISAQINSMEPQQHAMELAAASLDAYDRAHCNSGIALATAVLHLHAVWTMFSEKLPQGTALKHAWDFSRRLCTIDWIF